MNRNNRSLRALIVGLLIVSFGKATANNILKLRPALTRLITENIASLNQSHKSLAIAFKQNQDLTSPDVKAALEQAHQNDISIAECLKTAAVLTIESLTSANRRGTHKNHIPFYETYKELVDNESKSGAEKIQKEQGVDIREIYATHHKEIYKYLNSIQK
jgi:hypothetical protein